MRFLQVDNLQRIHIVDPPIVIEIVDASEKIEAFLPVLDEIVGEGLVTVEPARIILYRGPEKPRRRGLA